MRKKGYVTHPLEIVAVWLRYQPQLSATGGSKGNHTNMSLVTSTNILSMLKKNEMKHIPWWEFRQFGFMHPYLLYT